MKNTIARIFVFQFIFFIQAQAQTAITLIPDQKLGVVVLTNGHKSPIMAATYYALDQMLGTGENDWSADLLKRANENEVRDTRVADIKAKRISNTKPSLSLSDYGGIYYSEIYGEIELKLEGDQLRMLFSNSPRLNAILKHWHHDTFEIIWDEKHAWFNFGTVKFNMDNNMKVISMDFEVPNDDIFFEELKAKKVK